MIKNKNTLKGVILIQVLVIFIVLTAISTVTFSLFHTNYRQSEYQEKQIQAYFLALAGYEVCYEVLMQSKAADGSSYIALLDSYKADLSLETDIKDTIKIDGRDVEIQIIKEKDKEWVTIKSTSEIPKSKDSSEFFKSELTAEININKPELAKIEIKRP